MLVLCGPMVTLRFATADFMGPSILLGRAIMPVRNGCAITSL